jgi:GAF domain-containing protein
MDGSRLARVLASIAEHPDGELPERACLAAADLLDTPGVGISLLDGHSLQGVAATREAEAGERLQADLGEGPCYDADRGGRPVLVAELSEGHAWPAFAPAALQAGIRSTFAFPLRRGTVRLGALSLYRSSTGPLTDEHHEDALTFSRLVTDLLISLQAEMPARRLPELLAEPAAGAWQVHQATGMVAAQLDMPVGDALARLRAHAYAQDLPLEEVARAVVDRALRLDGVA